MLTKNTLPNPYGRQRLDLSSSVIPTSNKEWFARDILAKNHTGVHWDRTYNFPRNTCAGSKRIYEEKGFILEPGRPPTFSESNKKELKIMIEHNDYDTRTSAFNEKAQELAIDRQVNTLKNLEVK